MLELSGALLLNIDGEDIAVCASGTDIVVEIRRPRHLIRHIGSFVRARKLLRATANRLNAERLTLTISQNGAIIMTVGANARTTTIGRLLGVRNVEVTRRF